MSQLTDARATADKILASRSDWTELVGYAGLASAIVGVSPHDRPASRAHARFH